jgi:predicted DNA-binding protein (MmcQ/YjbR family)
MIRRNCVGWSKQLLRYDIKKWNWKRETEVNITATPTQRAKRRLEMDFEAAKDLCRSFPGSTEDIKWGADLVFSVGGKMFAVTGNERPAKGISFKADDERFLELTDRPGIIPAPYLARAKWVHVDSNGALTDKEAAELLRRSYELVFGKLTKKLQQEILAHE